MEHVQDYTIKNGLGIRITKGDTCQVIRLINREWVPIGQPYPLPVERNVLIWTETGIPASILAVALRVYELDHPGSQLRTMLTRVPVRRRPVRERETAVAC